LTHKHNSFCSLHCVTALSSSSYLSSSRVKDASGHTSTPAFSVDSELLRYFPGHVNAFQILLYGVYPVLSWSSRLSPCTALYPSVQRLGSLLSSIPRTCPSRLSLLSFMIRSIFSSCVCALTLSLLTLSFHEMPINRLWNLCCAASTCNHLIH